MTFCNSIEKTLFEPLPESLWTDYYGDRETDEIVLPHSTSFQSLGGPLLPAARHFRSLSSDYDDGETDDYNEGFADEPGTTSTTGPNGPAHHHHRRSHSEVKSLFQHGCLFAYAAPEGAAGATTTSTTTTPRQRTRKGSSSSSSAQPLSPSQARRKTASFSGFLAVSNSPPPTPPGSFSTLDSLPLGRHGPTFRYD